MALHSYSAVRTGGSGGWTVTRSSTDGLTAPQKSHFSFDDALVLNKTVLLELWNAMTSRLLETLRLTSTVADRPEHAFQDGADFADGASWADGGNVTVLATISNDNRHTIAQDTSNAIGSAAAVLILGANVTSKTEARSAIEAIRRALKRDSMAKSHPADYPASGSFGV
jgi:hypothetical protein